MFFFRFWYIIYIFLSTDFWHNSNIMPTAYIVLSNLIKYGRIDINIFMNICITLMLLQHYQRGDFLSYNQSNQKCTMKNISIIFPRLRETSIVLIYLLQRKWEHFTIRCMQCMDISAINRSKTGPTLNDKTVAENSISIV